MKTTEIVEWVKCSFAPLSIATPIPVVIKNIEEAIRYWNTHSAFEIVRMVDVAPTMDSVEIPPIIKTVVDVYQDSLEDDYYANHPMYALLGFVTVDKFSQDYLLTSRAYSAYKKYLGSDFSWEHLPSEDYTLPSRLLVQNLHPTTRRLAVSGLKRIVEGEDIKQEHILEWILRYSLALTRIGEGMILRKAGMIGVSNDGTDVAQLGINDKKELEESLRKDSRWAIIGTRK